MNQKKYLLVSTGVHGALLLVLLILPASSFTPEKPQPPALKINLQSSASIEAVLRQQTLQTTPPPPAPEPVFIDPEPVKVDPPKLTPKPQPVPNPKKSPKKTAPTLQKSRIEPKKPLQTKPKKPETKNRPDFNKFKKTERTLMPTQISAKERKQQQERAAKAAQDRQEEIHEKLGALSDLNLSNRSEMAELAVDIALENWRQFVRESYNRAWQLVKQTTEVSNSRSTVKAKVVVNLDGSVSAQIVQPSGLAELDDSVQDALNRVRKIDKKPPSKASIKDRTFTITFNLKDGRRINME